MKKRILCIMLSLTTLISISSSTVLASTNSSGEAKNAVSKNIQVNSSFHSSTLPLKKRQANPVRYLDSVFNDFNLYKDIKYKEAPNYKGEKGYVTVNINYRLNPNAENDWNVSLKNGMEDVVSSIKWVRANSKKYVIDKNKISLAGSSIGAMMSINLAYGTYVS